MKPTGKRRVFVFGPAAFCRLDQAMMDDLAEDGHIRTILIDACLMVVLGSTCYGAVFGIWHSPQQALFSSIKMPVLMLCVTLSSAIVNAMLAQIMGSGLSFKQVGACMLLGFAVTSIVLAALSPIVLFLVSQMPPRTDASAIPIYRLLLPLHTVVVGLCGMIGQVRLYRLLVALTGSKAMTGRIMCAWIAMSGLVGCELSWVISPFLARPDLPVVFFNPNAFTSNFFEYLWRSSTMGWHEVVPLAEWGRVAL